MNIGDLLCVLFLGFGMVDGYHKGFVKKGLSLLASIATLFIVYISYPYVARVLAFVVTYIVVRLAFQIAIMFLQVLVKVPVLSFTNRLFGAGIGVVQQLLLVWIFLLLLPVFSLTPIGDTLYETVQQGVLLGYLYQHNLLLLMGVLLLAKI